jgi:phytoene dehydrogenase-like protein
MREAFSSGVIDMQALTLDVEAKIGSPNGHVFHGELQVDRLFWARPARHWADYRTPIKGLYQCSSSADLCGGVGGVSGYDDAREILKGRKR